MTAAESLVEFKKLEKYSTPKHKERGKGKGGGDKEKSPKSGNGGSGKFSNSKWKSSKYGDKKKEKQGLASFLCDGPHKARDSERRSDGLNPKEIREPNLLTNRISPLA